MSSRVLAASLVVLGIGCLTMPPRPGGDASTQPFDGSGSARSGVLDVFVTDRSGALLDGATIRLTQDDINVGEPVLDSSLGAGHYRFAAVPTDPMTTIHVAHDGLAFPTPTVTVSAEGIAEALVRAGD